MPKQAEKCIIGIGNVLYSDDGVGAAVIEYIRAHFPLDENIEAVDAGSDGPGLFDIMAGRKRVVIVDAVADRKPPGTVLHVQLRDIHQRKRNMLSVHSFGITHALFWTEIIGKRPAVDIVGVTAACPFSPGLGLSPGVGMAVPRAAKKAVDIIGMAPGESASFSLSAFTGE